jgi:HptB-dependent secretion and biofilm anti anti-sigma factor
MITITITVPKVFTFESNQTVISAVTEFVSECESAEEIVLDFSNCVYIDSAALGAILILEDRYTDKKIILSNCAEPVKEAFEISNFYKRFTIT